MLSHSHGIDMGRDLAQDTPELQCSERIVSLPSLGDYGGHHAGVLRLDFGRQVVRRQFDIGRLQYCQHVIGHDCHAERQQRRAWVGGLTSLLRYRAPIRAVVTGFPCASGGDIHGRSCAP